LPATQKSQRWWAARQKDDKDPAGAELASRVTEVATQRESAQIARRWRSLVYYRHFTGRPTSGQFAFGMAKRPTAMLTYYGGFVFTPPRYNLIQVCSDIYVNRLLRQHVYLEFVPERGEFTQRQLSKDFSQWVEAGFEDLGFWDRFTKAGVDSLAFGSGLIKWGESLDGKLEITNPHPDEILLANEDEEYHPDMIQRVFASREGLLDRYGHDDDARHAIETATSAYPAFFFGPGTLDCDDVVPLLEAWRLPHGTKHKPIPGRHVLCVGNFSLLDEDWKETDFPVEKFDFKQLPGAYWGQGLSEVLLPINEEVDRLLSSIQENFIRLGDPKWLVEANSAVQESALGSGSGNVVKYTQISPQMIAPPTTNPEQFQHLERLIRLAMDSAHISQQAVAGETPKALQSAVALSKYSQITDANYAEMTGRLEAFVIRNAYQMIRLGKRLKPDFKLPGRQTQLIKWKKVEIFGSRPASATAFATSRLPQDISGRQQLIDSMLANGTISKGLHTKFSQVPDIDGMLDLLNAPQDSVDKMLDGLLTSDDYTPPVPFMDLDYALSAVEARYLLELDMETPREFLDRYLMWRAAVKELIDQRDTPDMPPAPAEGAAPGVQAPVAAGGFGVQTENPAVAPSPGQISPAMGAAPQGIQ
jgi:hypothetical protein